MFDEEKIKETFPKNGLDSYRIDWYLCHQIALGHIVAMQYFTEPISLEEIEASAHSWIVAFLSQDDPVNQFRFLVNTMGINIYEAFFDVLSQIPPLHLSEAATIVKKAMGDELCSY